MEEVSREELIAICNNFNKFIYDIYNYSNGQMKLKMVCKNVQKVLPKNIHIINLFDIQGNMVDIYIYSDVKNNCLDSGVLTRIVLDITDIKS